MGRVEQTIEGVGGCELATWRSQVDEPKAGAVILHGYGDHSGRYEHVVEMLNGLGVSCYLLDLRGHGASEGPRGALKAWEQYLDDLAIFLGHVGKWHGSEPSVVLGHSMGGLVAASYLIQRPHPFSTLILSSPFFDIAVKPNPVKLAAGKLLSRIMPSLSLPTEIDPAMLSHDEAVCAAYASDPLGHKVVNTRWMTETFAAQEQALAQADKVKVKSVLEFYGTSDPLVSPQAAQDFFDALTVDDATCVPFEGMLHECMNELENHKVLGMIEQWLGKRL